MILVILPSSQVFDHDWFATPFVLMTCKVRSQPVRHVLACSTSLHYRRMGPLMNRTGMTYNVYFVSIILDKYYHIRQILYGNIF